MRSFSCGMQDLLVWHVGSLLGRVGSLLLHVESISSSMLGLSVVACEILLVRLCLFFIAACGILLQHVRSFCCGMLDLCYGMWDLYSSIIWYLCCSMRDLWLCYGISLNVAYSIF